MSLTKEHLVYRIDDIHLDDTGQRVVDLNWSHRDGIEVGEVADRIVVPHSASDDEILELIEQKKDVILEDWIRNGIGADKPIVPETKLIGRIG